MTRYKKKVTCPEDLIKLGWSELVETRANNAYTYYCKSCDTYWHVDWYKKTKPETKNWTWDYKYIYDDYGKRFELLPKV